MRYKIEAQHWDHGIIPEAPDHKHKGRAIDRVLREEFGSTSGVNESYDMQLFVHEWDVHWHEFKSTSSKTISISRMELDLAQRKYRDGQDLMYWVCDQTDERDYFELDYLIKYSTLLKNNLFEQSNFDSQAVYFGYEYCRKFRDIKC